MRRFINLFDDSRFFTAALGAVALVIALFADAGSLWETRGVAMFWGCLVGHIVARDMRRRLYDSNLRTAKLLLRVHDSGRESDR